MSEEEKKFKPGDTVQLISGGPIMTVRMYDEMLSGDVICQWFDGTKLLSGEFAEASLKVAENRGGGVF